MPGTAEPGDDDPRIYPDEITAAAMDSRDPAWKPAYEWFEDPTTLNCGERQACEDHKAIEVAKAENQTGGL